MVKDEWRAALIDRAYSCDRDLGMALGRPPAIQDEWVTAAVSTFRPIARLFTRIPLLSVGASADASSRATAKTRSSPPLPSFRARHLRPNSPHYTSSASAGSSPKSYTACTPRRSPRSRTRAGLLACRPLSMHGAMIVRPALVFARTSGSAYASTRRSRCCTGHLRETRRPRVRAWTRH